MELIQVKVQNLQTKVKFNFGRISSVIQKILKYEGVVGARLCVVFVSGQKMCAFNRRFKKHNYTTDVLAFDLREENFGSEANKEIIGDIMISADEAVKNSRLYHTSVDHELVLYVTHGILHLLGYDDQQPRNIAKMRAKENEILTFLKI